MTNNTPKEEVDISKIIEDVGRAGERLGELKERSRILDEIEKANLPAGVWPLIRNIITPLT